MKVGRNDPCSCGSGKKYKKCCMRKHEEEASAKAATRSTPAADPKALEGPMPMPSALAEAASVEAELSADKLQDVSAAAAQLKDSNDPAQIKKLQEQMAALQALMNLQGKK